MMTPEVNVYYITHGELSKRLKLLKEDTRLNHIEPTLKGNIEKIIHSYNDIFSLPGYLIPSSKLTRHKIVLTQDKIVNNRSYKPPEYHKKKIQTQVSNMITKKVIRNSEYPYNSPLWEDPKKVDASGLKKWRVVRDFRKVNEITDHDGYQLPVIEYLGHVITKDGVKLNPAKLQALAEFRIPKSAYGSLLIFRTFRILPKIY